MTDHSFEQRDKKRDALIEKLDQSALRSDRKWYSEKSRQLDLKLKSARTTQEASVRMTRIEIPVQPEQVPKE